MKAIILAGGSGTRLYPITAATCKQLLPIYDKPMIYYPLSVLMLAGLKDILIICRRQDLSRFKSLLGFGTALGINISYEVQDTPRGVAEAFSVGEEFIGNEKVCLILGDNLFYGQGFSELLRDARTNRQNNHGATIFAYPVSNPQEFGIVDFDANLNILSVEEKPSQPKSSFAITGLYFYDNSVVEIAKSITPSVRGELEITNINAVYLEQGLLSVEVLGRGFTWLDTGSVDNLLDASTFVQTLEKRQGLKIACIEEISWRNGWISSENLEEISENLGKTDYAVYLKSLLN
jgi:glucose-1-phosphate thymidylyltransferase